MTTPQDLPRRTRRGPEQLRAIIAGFDASGLSRSAFCRQHSISASTFDRWYSHPHDQPDSVIASDKDTAVFIELSDTVDLAGSDSDQASRPDVAGIAWDIELQIDDGMVLRLRRPC